MKVLLSLLFFLSFSVQAQTAIETISLKHRLADEIIQQITPLLPADAVISAFGNDIILKADSTTRHDIRQLIAQLDKRQNSIRITVMRSQQRLEDRAGAQDRLNLDFRNPSNSSAEIRRWSTQDSRERDQHYQARGIEGRSITLQLGQLIPQTNHVIYLTQHGVAVTESTYYLAADNGFQAVVNLLADQQQYQIALYPRFSAYNTHSGQLSTTELISTLNGEIDQWILIGQIGEQSQQLSGRQYRSHRDQQQYLYLKVEIL